VRGAELQYSTKEKGHIEETGTFESDRKSIQINRSQVTGEKSYREKQTDGKERRKDEEKGNRKERDRQKSHKGEREKRLLEKA
jgi:hypothetical protein